jgi:hypothetical protein
LETRDTGSGPTESNCRRRQGSLWTVAPTEEEKGEKEKKEKEEGEENKKEKDNEEEDY